MGKYKQWLHHQEVGRRLREQIATHEQERERVQRMAPSHPTTLPDTNNPLIRALLDYTGRGNTLGRVPGTRLTGTPDSDPQQRQPVEGARGYISSTPTTPTSTATGAANAAGAAPPPAGQGNPIAAELAARAAQTPADPLDAMRSLAQAQRRDPQSDNPAAPPAGGSAPEGANPGEWWQQYRSQSS
jgi:hypothetical protein